LRIKTSLDWVSVETELKRNIQKPTSFRGSLTQNSKELIQLLRNIEKMVVKLSNAEIIFRQSKGLKSKQKINQLVDEINQSIDEFEKFAMFEILLR